MFLGHQYSCPFPKWGRVHSKESNQLQEIHLPIFVLGELRYDAMKSARREENLEKTSSFMLECQVYPIDDATTGYYGAIKLALAQQGTPIPENDTWIAALAKEYDLPIVTRDKHFGHVPGIEIIEW